MSQGDDPREIVQNIVFGSQYEGCRDEMKLVSLVPPPYFSGMLQLPPARINTCCIIFLTTRQTLNWMYVMFTFLFLFQI